MRPVKDLLFQDLHDYAGMNPEAAEVMGWPDKDHAIELDEHQSEAVRVKNTYYNTHIYKIQEVITLQKYLVPIFIMSVK